MTFVTPTPQGMRTRRERHRFGPVRDLVPRLGGLAVPMDIVALIEGDSERGLTAVREGAADFVPVDGGVDADVALGETAFTRVGDGWMPIMQPDEQAAAKLADLRAHLDAGGGAKQTGPQRPVGGAGPLCRAALAGGRARRNVYRHAGRPCARCGELVRSRGQGDENRTAYWCPGCQAGGGPPES